nr:hypothetical protein Itr_chr05CG11960 [Ipomoea trifida]
MDSWSRVVVAVLSPQRRTRKKLRMSTALVVDSVSVGRSPVIPTQNSAMVSQLQCANFVSACVSRSRRVEQPVLNSDSENGEGRQQDNPNGSSTLERPKCTLPPVRYQMLNPMADHADERDSVVESVMDKIT